MHTSRLVFWIVVSIVVLTGVAPLRAETVVGTSSGVFENPTGPATMVTSGVNTNQFTWGSGTPPSSLTFTGLAFSAATETQFKVGTLDYYNGTIVSGTGADAVDLAVTLDITAPTGATGHFTYALQLINTLNTGDPVGDADYVQLPSLFPSTIFSLGGIDYTLKLEFGQSGPGGFTAIDQFHVLEDGRASADLMGTITADTSQVVPEPGTWMLLAGGLLAAVAWRRQRR